jgi:uncharacterized protein YcbX
MDAFVSGLAVTAVKATKIGAVQRIEIDELGARGNRAFCVIDDRGRMVNAKNFPRLMTVVSRYDVESGELALSFPDGSKIADTVRRGEPLPITFFSQPCTARLVIGPWADALSEHIDAPLRIVEPDVGVDRGRDGAVSLISRASVQHLAEVGDADSVDVRRFRMLIEIAGVDPYEEDGWIGREVTIGSARVRIRGNVGRCAITTRDPESAAVDFPTLKLLARYRREMETTEPLPFGVYGGVVAPGQVTVGDPLTVVA